MLLDPLDEHLLYLCIYPRLDLLINCLPPKDLSRLRNLMAIRRETKSFCDGRDCNSHCCAALFCGPYILSRLFNHGKFLSPAYFR